MTTLQPVKGTRDFYPEEFRLRNWVFEIWRETSRQFGFMEYDTCVLESEELYIRKAGDEITEQLYSFEDKGGRRIALRPEMTPSLARLVLQRQRSLNFPLKWFSIPQCFRYERMTRGRKREHYQWNLDLIGEADSLAEVEVISALLTSLEAMGLTAEHVELRINDRAILNGLLAHLGVAEEQHMAAMVIIDKREKVTPEAMDKMLSDLGLTKSQITKLNSFFEAAPKGLPAVRKKLGKFADTTRNLEELVNLLGQVGFGDYLTVDCSVVRGLSYYTGTVFELRDRRGKLRAICGGGRYDSLLSAYGGDAMPAVGFGFGDVVIVELLSDLGLLPEFTQELDYVVIPFSREQAVKALEVGRSLRRSGFRVDVDMTFRKLKRALNRADELGASKAVLLFPDELERGMVKVRDLANRTEQEIPLDNLSSDPYTQGLPPDEFLDILKHQ